MHALKRRPGRNAPSQPVYLVYDQEGLGDADVIKPAYALLIASTGKKLEDAFQENVSRLPRASCKV